MACHDFFFALEVSSHAPASLVDELAEQVLKHVGCSLGDAPDLTAACERAIADGARHHRICDVQFCAHDGSLEIRVSSNGGPQWHTSVNIP